MANRVVFLTGVTGALGSWIAQRSLGDGMFVRALARSSASQSARERVVQSLAVPADEPMSPRVEVIDGDILDEHIDPGRIDLVIHCAACTAFHDRSAQASHQTNVQGLARMLNLASRHRTPFVHISTAYVCGQRSGAAIESELDVGQSFNNVYERSKCEGEALVHEWSARTGLCAIVLRPSVVLGDWSRGRAVRFNTLYHLMRVLDAACASRPSRPLHLLGHADVTKNIIPVDYFADVAWELIRRGLPGTYHVTHPDPIRMRDLRDIFSELFEIDLRLVPDEHFDRERGTPIERTCLRVMSPYRPYMMNPEPRFEQRSTINALGGAIAGPPKVDAAYFRRLLEYARKANWGRDIPAAPMAPVADNAMAMDPIRQYFEVFLAERTNQSLLPDLKRLSARVSISMKDQPGSTWWLDLQQGVLRSISRHSAPANCSFSLNSKTFLEIAAGRLPPQRAFFTGRVGITGNMELGLKVATVLAKFFKEYPFVAELV